MFVLAIFNIHAILFQMTACEKTGVLQMIYIFFEDCEVDNFHRIANFIKMYWCKCMFYYFVFSKFRTCALKFFRKELYQFSRWKFSDTSFTWLKKWYPCTISLFLVMLLFWFWTVLNPFKTGECFPQGNVSFLSFFLVCLLLLNNSIWKIKTEKMNPFHLQKIKTEKVKPFHLQLPRNCFMVWNVTCFNMGQQTTCR